MGTEARLIVISLLIQQANHALIFVLRERNKNPLRSGHQTATQGLAKSITPQLHSDLSKTRFQCRETADVILLSQVRQNAELNQRAASEGNEREKLKAK
jgi:hypothetical protein